MMLTHSKITLFAALVVLVSAKMETGQKKAFAIDSKAETVALSPTKVEKPKHPVDEEMAAHMTPKSGGNIANEGKPVDDKLIRSHEETQKAQLAAKPTEVESATPAAPASTSPIQEVEAQWRNLNIFWMSTVAISFALLMAMAATAVYFKRQAESLKAKATGGAESAEEESEEDETSSYETNNPKVLVNKQLLERMTSISMKLKASVMKARSESSSSSASTRKGPEKAAAAPQAAPSQEPPMVSEGAAPIGGEIRMED